MKIKLVSRKNGTIVAGVLPPKRGARNVVVAGIALSPGMKLDEVALPAGMRGANIEKMLVGSRIKKGKKSVSLVLAKRRPSRTRAARKARR